MNLQNVNEADHAVRHWNANVDPGDQVIRIDDLGHPHRTTVTGRAYVMPSGTPVARVADQGLYKLSRLWRPKTLNALLEEAGHEDEEIIEALKG